MGENTQIMVYIGVDGGGTKTALAAYENEELIASSRVGACNYNFIGVDAAVKNLVDGIASLGIPLDRVGAVGIGDPSIDDVVPDGVDTPTAQFLKQAEAAIGVSVFIRSDAYMTLFALSGGEEPAVLMLSGTGSMGIAEDAAGVTHIVGGWGRLTGDEGSGYFIALEGIKSALRAIDGVGPSSTLAQEVLAFFNVNNPRDLIGAFYQDKKPEIAGFSRIVSKCAEQGDKVAHDILLQAAKCLSLYACSLLKQTKANLLGVYGSVLCNDVIVRKEFERLVLMEFPNVAIQVPSISPEHAAAIYAQKQHLKS